MSKILRNILLVLTVSVLCSCRSHEVAYISDAQRDTAQTVIANYAATIMPGDQLYIYVGSSTPESVIPFNQETHGISMMGNRLEYLDTNRSGVISQGEGNMTEETQYLTATVSGYFVSERGTIDFPILGELDVNDITQDSLCNYLESRLKVEGYVNDPIVTVKLLNFRVTVLGEVRRPQQIHVPGTRLTIFEALAICGDLTEYGQRENLMVIRSENGQQIVGEIDLTKREMLDSPYYYLHNNDIVYVEPNDYKKKSSDRDPNLPRYISMGVSLWSAIRTSINSSRQVRKYKNEFHEGIFE